MNNNIRYNESKVCPYCGKTKESKYNEYAQKMFYIMCECEINEETKRSEAQREKAESTYIELRSTSSHLLKKERTAKFSSMNVDTENEKAINAAKYITELLLNEQTNVTKNGLILCGTAGSGKTFITAAIINEYHARQGFKDWVIKDIVKGVKINVESDCKFIREYDLLRLSNRYDFNNKIDPIDEYKKAKKLLVIDDVGASASDNKKDTAALLDIIDYRYSEQLSIIITTNLTKKDLKSYVGDRAFDRLENSCYIIGLTAAQSRRKAND